ncbi:MAG: bacteriochlorophyll 4-vinyl reductase [Pseudomonadota bacterium]
MTASGEAFPRPAPGSALIGPNALLQLVPVLDRVGGRQLRQEIFASAGVFALPEADNGMIDETPVARVHQAVRRDLGDLAVAVAWEAGKRTGDYIRVNRIPRGAQALLRMLPEHTASPMLARAIAKNAWTFVGSGTFRLVSTRPVVFEIVDNPVVRHEHSDHPLCHWHASVFERLFTKLVDPNLRCEETQCCAMGASACRFEIKQDAGSGGPKFR